LPDLDTSSIIYAWDNYPIDNFPPLWRWLGEQISNGAFVMSEVAFQEVENKMPECAKWLSDQGITKIKVSNEILEEAMRIKGLLGISEDNYQSKGVGESDLIIIAAASVTGSELVTNEARQTTLPSIPANMKIPAVCDSPDVRVPWMDFLALIKRSNRKFGR